MAEQLSMASILADLPLASGPEVSVDVSSSGLPCGQPRVECVDEAGELTCAICLEVPAPVDMAFIRGCEHMYCVNCILKWSQYRETSRCPQCKQQFDYLYVHKMLDGTISDYPIEESVVLLKRAKWFTEHVMAEEKGKLVAAADVDWDGAGYYDEDEDYDEDEEIEKFYFSSAAGRARIVIGNRRWGENGSVRAGRMYARPASSNSAAPQSTPKTGGKGGKGAGSSGTGGSYDSSRVGAASCEAGGGSSSSSTAADAAAGSGTAHASAPRAGNAAAAPAATASGSGASGGSTSSKLPVAAAGPARAAAAPAAAGGSGSGASTAGKAAAGGGGRRSRRNARRAAADLELDDDDYGDYY